jgi:F-type H+-transporting ATPase subunit a
VQYTAFKELGFLGYMDHMAGQPRGFMAITVIIPLFMFLMHVMGEFIKPLSLSLRLRSNMWGDEMLLGVLAGFGLTGIPLLIFNMVMMLVAAVVQAVVFSLLTTIYFAIVLEGHDVEHINKEGGSI